MQPEKRDAGSGFRGSFLFQMQPRMVRCHQCNLLSQEQYVCEKGAIEGRPEAGVLECWWCYIQRTDTNLTWGNVAPLFKKLFEDRGDRVLGWQDHLLSYVTIDEEAEGSKQNLRAQKRAFDTVNAERIESETSGGGASSTERQDTAEDVNFKMLDQYVGVNDVVYDGKKCLLFNWASTTAKKTNVGMATLVNKATGRRLPRV